MIDFTDKRILVAGASSGIGAQTAITLSEYGAKVIVVARREEKLKEVLSKMTGSGHSYYCADLSNISRIENLIKTIVNDQGSLDGVVFSVGITDDCPLKLLTYEKIINLFNTNFFSFLEIVRQVAKKGNFNKNMRIVAVSSVSASRGAKAHTIYSASKAAMDSSVRCMAKELASKNIYINTVAPSAIMTQMYEGFMGRIDNNYEVKHNSYCQYLGIGEPQDVANSICFLLSPAAKFITGVTLPVDGGYLS